MWTVRDTSCLDFTAHMDFTVHLELYRSPELYRSLWTLPPTWTLPPILNFTVQKHLDFTVHIRKHPFVVNVHNIASWHYISIAPLALMYQQEKNHMPIHLTIKQTTRVITTTPYLFRKPLFGLGSPSGLSSGPPVVSCTEPWHDLAAHSKNTSL